MIATHNFDTLYHQLATAWESHQRLRRGHASLMDLADSAARLDIARQDMWNWHRSHDIKAG